MNQQSQRRFVSATDEADNRVVFLLTSVAQGKAEAEFQLWNLVEHRLKLFAKQQLYSQGNFDEDDVANIVFTKFCFALRNGTTRQITRSRHLTRYLARSAKNTITDLIRSEHRQKRRCVRVSSVEVHRLEDRKSHQYIEVKDQLNQFVSGLAFRDRQVLMGVSSGHTNRQLAQSLGCSIRSIERRVKRIRARMHRVFGLSETNPRKPLQEAHDYGPQCKT